MTEDSNYTPTDVTEFTPEHIKELYPKLVNAYFESIRTCSIECIDFGERNRLWQNLEDNSDSPMNIVGWLVALSSIEEMQAGGQARWEMSSSCEQTQFAVELANTIHDLAMQLKSIASSLATYKSHYLSLITGRRKLNVNYTSGTGDFVPLDDLLDSVNTTAAIKFNNERLAEGERIRRQKPLEFFRYVEIADDALAAALKPSVCVRSATSEHP